MATKKPAASAAKEPAFTKEALMNSKLFRKQRDFVSAFLKDGEEYTVSEVETIIENFKKGKVK